MDVLIVTHSFEDWEEWGGGGGGRVELHGSVV